MSQVFRDSIDVANANLLLIGVVGIGRSVAEVNGPRVLQALFFVIATIAGILVYGRIVARFVPERSVSARSILKENLVNYIVVSVVLGVPAIMFWLVVPFFSVLGQGGISILISVVVVPVVVALLTLYVLPVVFLEKTNFRAIGVGIWYLPECPRSNLFIGGVVVFAYALRLASSIIGPRVPHKMSQVLDGGCEMGATYLLFISFAAAVQLYTSGRVGRN